MPKFSIFIPLLINCLLIATAQETGSSLIEENMESNLVQPLEIAGFTNPFGEDIENVPRDLLLSWQIRRAIRKILAQMPYGWSEYNIPPLAPYENENLSIDIENSIFSTKTKFSPLRIDGLDNMEIKRLNVGIILKRINFDFNFPNITFTGNFDTSTTINLQELINVKILAMGGGKLKLCFENLRVAGSIRYKLPIFFGSAKIYNLRAEVSVGNVSSELSGFINGIPIGGKLNDLIATNILKYLNNYDFLWNGLIDKFVLPTINLGLEGKTLWKIILWSITHSEVEIESLDTADLAEFHQMLLRKKPLVAQNEVYNIGF